MALKTCILMWSVLICMFTKTFHWKWLLCQRPCTDYILALVYPFFSFVSDLRVLFIFALNFSVFSCSSCFTSHCGSWTCWSGLSPAWFYTSYTLCCALSVGTTRCLWALFFSATTMCFLNYSETASCWEKPTPTLCPPTVWGWSPSRGSARGHLTSELRIGNRRRGRPLGVEDRLWTHNCVLIRFYF